jgi:hypothetical protein
MGDRLFIVVVVGAGICSLALFAVALLGVLS